MSIQFNEVPEGALTHFFAVEVDNTGALGLGGAMPWKALLIGSDGKSPEESPGEAPKTHQIFSADELVAAGMAPDSALVRMVRLWQKNAPFTIPLFVRVARSPSEVAAALASLGDEWWNLVAVDQEEDAFSTEALASLKARAGATGARPTVVVFARKAASVSESLAAVENLNSPSLVSIPFAHEAHPGEWAAAFAGAIARSASQDPAMPFQTLEVLGLQAPEAGYTRLEREALLKGGVASWTRVGNGVFLERMATTYLKNNAGAEDGSYRDLSTVLTLSYLRWSILTLFSTKYARHKLADDDARFGDGQPVLTPKTARAELVGLYREWERAGLVEGAEAFKAALLVERNVRDRNRLDIYLRPDVINQLTVLGVKMGFLL